MPRVLIRRITPKAPIFNVDYFVSNMNSTIRSDTVPTVIADFKRGVRTWEHKPDFSSRVTINERKVQVDIFPSGVNRQQYLWVHNGVPGRLITPRSDNKSGVLRFRPGYVAATSPGFIGSRRGFSTGGFISTSAVNWPGIKARNFSKTIAQHNRPRFANDVRNVLRRAARR